MGVQVDVETGWRVGLELGRVVDDWHFEHVPERLHSRPRVLPRGSKNSNHAFLQQRTRYNDNKYVIIIFRPLFLWENI